MGKYTKYGAKIESYVDSKIEIVIKELRCRVPDLKSVLLIGGYGRGGCC